MNYIVFDWETGGLDSTKHAVTELAMIGLKSDTFEEVGRISTFVQPYGDYEYTEKALELTGITDENIISGVDVKDLVNQMIDLFEQTRTGKRHDDKPILVAHNVQFDINFTLQVFKEAKQDLSKYVQGNKDFYGNFQPHFIDTIDLCKMKWDRRKGEIKNYKLGTCVQKANIDLVGAHRAINDTISLKELFVLLVSDLRASDGGGQLEYRFRDNFKFEMK